MTDNKTQHKNDGPPLGHERLNLNDEFNDDQCDILEARPVKKPLGSPPPRNTRVIDKSRNSGDVDINDELPGGTVSISEGDRLSFGKTLLLFSAILLALAATAVIIFPENTGAQDVWGFAQVAIPPIVTAVVFTYFRNKE